MLRLTIVKTDNLVGIDGVFRIVDCSSLPSDFHALQWDAENSRGEVEWSGDPKPSNTRISDIKEYEPIVDAWKKAEPLPTPQPTIKDTQICEEAEPVKVDGEWYQAWTVRDLTAEEIATKAAERKARLTAEINAYRDVKVAQGFSFNGTMFDSRPEDQKRISGAGLLAFMALSQGAQPGDYFWHGGAAPFVWIAQDNSTVPMDAATVVAFGKKAAEHESYHIFAARQLKDMDPIPDNFMDPAYWP